MQIIFKYLMNKGKKTFSHLKNIVTVGYK